MYEDRVFDISNSRHIDMQYSFEVVGIFHEYSCWYLYVINDKTLMVQEIHTCHDIGYFV